MKKIIAEEKTSSHAFSESVEIILLLSGFSMSGC